MTTFKAIEMENYKDEPLQFVGVYVLRWRPEWGEPSIGFVADDETESKLERLKRIEEAAKHALEWLNNAPFDYSNGNEAFGVDEGNVYGWKAHKELVKELSLALEKK